jgi:membrane protein
MPAPRFNAVRAAPRRLAPWILGRRPPEPAGDAPPPPTPEEAEALEPGRGRAAQTPRGIPRRGWIDIAIRTWNSFNADRLPAVSAGIAFYGLLSLFPTMAAFVSLYGLFADVSTAQQQLAYLAGVVPAEVLTFIGQEMTRIAGERTGSLSLTFVVSLLLSLWSANAASKALFGGLNVAYHETEKRGFLIINLETLAFTLGAVVFLIMAAASIVVVPLLFEFLPLGIGAALLSLLRWPILVAFMTVGLAALYRFGPSRRAAEWRWLSWGAVIAAVLWLGASLAFSWYVSNVADYAATYGSLGAVVGLMMWMWVSALVVLLGAELNSEIEHQTAVDTTKGADKPMGRRGALVADTLGEASGKGAVKAGTTVATAG